VNKRPPASRSPPPPPWVMAMYQLGLELFAAAWAFVCQVAYPVP
jgi:hypothetical protein